MNFPKRPEGQVPLDRKLLKQQENNQSFASKYTEEELGFKPTSIDSFPPTLTDHIKAKMYQHPVVPLTFGATVGAFAMMTKNRKNSAALNMWGRVRLASQGACFVSLFYAMYMDEMENRSKNPQSANQKSWMPFHWFTGDDQSSKDIRSKYFEKH